MVAKREMRDRVNMVIPRSTKQKLDERAEVLGVNRSMLITMIIEQHFQQTQVIETLKDMKGLPDILYKMQELTDKLKNMRSED